MVFHKSAVVIPALDIPITCRWKSLSLVVWPSRKNGLPGLPTATLTPLGPETIHQDWRCLGMVQTRMLLPCGKAAIIMNNGRQRGIKIRGQWKNTRARVSSRETSLNKTNYQINHLYPSSIVNHPDSLRIALSPAKDAKVKHQSCLNLDTSRIIPRIASGQ